MKNRLETARRLIHGQLYSERDGAFINDDDYMTRGENFHVEALELWHAQKDTPSVASLVNLQALCVLFLRYVETLDCCYYPHLLTQYPLAA
jgi:hypothetical protein